MRKLESSFDQMQSNKRIKAKYLENKAEKIEMEENAVNTRVELRQFNTIRNILDRDNNFVNNKINT